MADSDEEYVQDLSEGEDLAQQSRGGGQYGTRLGMFSVVVSESFGRRLTYHQPDRAAGPRLLASPGEVKNDGRISNEVGTS